MKSIASPLRRWKAGLVGLARDHRLIVLLLLLVLAYGGLLRFEALHRVYGPIAVGRLQPLEVRVAEAVANIRPAIRYERGLYPYRFDPKSFIVSAREMRHFYEARLREPLFVAATWLGLKAVGGRDVGVSVASSVFSWLVLVATFWLGCEVGGAWVGLGAAALLALDRGLIQWSALGYRTEAFVACAVLFVAAVLHARRKEQGRLAVMAGVFGAATVLTRLSALSFVLLLPALLAAVDRWRGEAQDGRRQLITIATTTVLIVPFLFTSWREFGDPLYSVSWHWQNFYVGRAGLDFDVVPSVVSYIAHRLREAPLEFVDSLLRGFTGYTWSSHWRGLTPTLGVVGTVGLQVLAFCGLLGWIWTTTGRLLLAALVLLMAPFVVTWEIWNQPRFTMHAYPFFVVAASHATILLVQTAGWFLRAPRSERRAWMPKHVAPRAMVVCAIVFIVALWLLALPVSLAYQRETKSAVTGVAASWRDYFFIGPGWDLPRREGNQVIRESTADRANVRFLIGEPRRLHCLLRIGAVPRSRVRARVVSLRLNDHWYRKFRLPGDGYMPRFEFAVPASAVRAGWNQVWLAVERAGPLSLAGTASERTSARFRFWYLNCESSERGRQ